MVAIEGGEAVASPDGGGVVEAVKVPLSEAAYLLGREYQHVLRDVQAGRLTGTRVGKHWYVLRSALENALAA